MSNLALERSFAPVGIRTRIRRSAKRTVLAGLAIAAVLGAARYGDRWWQEGRFIESTDDAYVGGNVTPISPHIASFVSRILVGDNEHVEAGQLLLRLDDQDMRAAADHAQAVLNARQAMLAGLKARTELQRCIVRQGSAELDARRAQADFARQDAERYRNLATTSAASRQEAQRATALDLQTTAAVHSAAAALGAAAQQRGVRGADATEAAAEVAQAAADLRTARLNLGYTELRSPIEGYVGSRAAQAGAFVSTGAYLLTIVPAHRLWVDANFKEDQLGRMRPGMPASVVADVMPGRVMHGRVLSLAPGTGAIFSVIPPENATGNFTKIVQRVPVRIELDAGDATLGGVRPGLSVTVRVDTRPGSGSNGRGAS